jgi:GH15 family glucan-1,4-alpha-glucosidase
MAGKSWTKSRSTMSVVTNIRDRCALEMPLNQQLQLDIYGEMMDSIYLANKYGHSISHSGWQDVERILAWLGKNWQRPDEGIWEVRGGAKEFVHSRVMCWVAFDRALRLALTRSLDGPLNVWRRTRDEIRNDIFTNFWDGELQSFVQVKGTQNLGASTLLMPMMRFISPVDPMWLNWPRHWRWEPITVARKIHRGAADSHHG